MKRTLKTHRAQGFVFRLVQVLQEAYKTQGSIAAYYEVQARPATFLAWAKGVWTNLSERVTSRTACLANFDNLIAAAGKKGGVL